MARTSKGILIVMAVLLLSACSFFGGREKVPERNNVALGKEVEAAHERTDWPATNAVDGEWIARESRWLATANSDRPIWLVIDLADTYVIDGAAVYTGDATSDSNFPVSEYKLQYWDGDDWVDIPGASIEDNEDEDVFFEFDQPITTDRVRFFTDAIDDGVIRVREIVIYEKLQEED